MAMEKKIKGIECKFAVHIPTRDYDVPDYHMVKEVVHYEDGTFEPRLRLIKNYERSVWIENTPTQDYKQKKEFQKLDRLTEYKCTQSRLQQTIADALKVKNAYGMTVKKLCASPFVYGADIKSTALIKYDYKKKYPNIESPWEVAGFDTETAMEGPNTGDVIMASLVMKGKAVLAVDRTFLLGIPEGSVQRRFDEACDRYIGNILKKYGIKPKLFIVDGPVEILKVIFNHAHEWRPDFLEIWNINFDIPKVLDMCKKYNADPKDILCDPKIPKHLRVCKYIKGPDKKVTSSGKQIPINMAAQWHTLLLTASFYVIDGMCGYKHIRTGQQELADGYSLDNVLKKTIKRGKLKTVPEADKYEAGNWHSFMQGMYKIEYMVYNLYDSLGMLECDEEIKDLCYTMPSYSGISDFADFKSQPRRIVDALHFFYLDRGVVIGTTGFIDKPDDVDDDMGMDDDPDVINLGGDEEEEEDEMAEYAASDHTLGLKGWILTLQAINSVFGLPLIIEDGTLTNIRLLVYDSDAVSSYPTCVSVGNVSKATTLSELIDIVGIDDYMFRMQNLNLILGRVNGIEYCVNMFHAPSPDDLLEMF